MRLRILLLAATVLTSAPVHAAEPESGTIEICRAERLADRHKDAAIEVPAGAVFGDTGVAGEGKDRGPYWPLWITTTEPMRIEAARACGSVKARISANLDRRRVQRTDNRLFVPSAVMQGGIAKWPGDLRLTATVASDFK